MKTQFLIIAIAATLCITGCTSTRSISNSGYGQHYRVPTGFTNEELDEYDVLGIDTNHAVNESEIQAALVGNEVRLVPGSKILLIQPGALFPDAHLLAAFKECFRVVPFSGFQPVPGKTVPPHDVDQRTASLSINTSRTPANITFSEERTRAQQTSELPEPPFADTLRLIAARAQCDAIVCCWGMIESASEPMATKTVSWLPVLRWLTLDELHHSRIQLRVAVIDVATGAWTVVGSEPIEDTAWSTRPRREAVDQKQMEHLKSEAYHSAARQLAQLQNSLNN